MSARVKRPAGPFAGLYECSDLSDGVKLVVLGSACAVVEDKNAHAGVETCLVQHPQDSQLLLDRFDGRNLLGLHEINAFEAEWGSKPGEAADLHSLELGVTLADLNNERYGELDPSREHLLEDPYGFIEFSTSRQHQDAQQDREQSSNSGDAPHQGPAFAFDYGMTQPSGQQQQQGLSDDSHHKPPPLLPMDDTGSARQAFGAAFEPPFENIPLHLLHHMPSTDRQHQIISQTARFVCTNGSQVEVLLRVKHGGNPNFAFLIPEDRLFPYYRWLVDEDPQELLKEQPPPAATGPADVASAATSSLDADEGHQQQGNVHSQYAELDQQQQNGVAAAEAASPTAGNAGGMGALDLLHAYSMASEHESEQEGIDNQQQELPDSVTTVAEGAHGVDAGTEGSVAGVYGPELPAVLGSSSPAEDLAQQMLQAAIVPATAADGKVGTSKAAAATAHAVGAAADAVEAGPAAADRAGLPVEACRHTPASTANAVACEPAADAAAVAAAAPEASAAEPAADAAGEPAAPGTEEQLPDPPPAQLKAIIDKLVGFVRKNGIKFELVVRTRERSNPRFTFLHPWGPHHAYYRRELELAMGIEPVAQLLKNVQPGQPDTVAADSSRAIQVAHAAEVGKPAQKLMALKANPRLVVAPKRSTPAAAAAAAGAQEQAASAETQAADRPEDLAVLTGNEPESQGGAAATTTKGVSGAGASASAAAAAAAAAAATAAALVAAATAPAPTPSAAERKDPATALAKKRLKLQMYLKQKRAEQLAEHEQQEQEKKARAILAHRMLLKRLAAAGGEGEAGHSESDHEQEGLQGGSGQVTVAASVPVQSPEVEEGEIEETDEIDEIAEGSVAKAAADATAVEKRSEVRQLLQPEGPVLTTLPGLKELAISAAAAAAKHRAALLAGSDDEQEAAVVEPGSTAALAAALKARLAAVKKSRFDTGPPVPQPSIEGAAAMPVGPMVPAAAPSVANSSSMAVNMVAAANAAAAVIAAQAAGVPAASVLPVPASLPLQAQLQPIVPVLAPDTGLAAALAAAAASAAAAAAVQPKAGGKQVAATSSNTSDHSKDKHSSISGEDDERPGSRPASRSPSTSSQSRSRSSSKLSKSPSRSRSYSSSDRHSSRSSSPSPAQASSKPRVKLRRGDSAQRKRSRSRSRSDSRHRSKRLRSSSRHRHRHKNGSFRKRRHQGKRGHSASRSRSRSTDDRRRRQKHKRSILKYHRDSKKDRSSRRKSRHSRKKRKGKSKSSSLSISSDSSSSSDCGGCNSKLHSRSSLPAAVRQSATYVPMTAAAASAEDDSKQAVAARSPATAASLPAVPVDSDKLRQRLRQMLGQLQK